MSLIAQRFLIGLLSLLLLASVITVGYVKVQEAKAEVPEPYITAEAAECINCHSDKGISKSAVRDWKLSAHAVKGVGCDKCHIPSPDAVPEILEAETVCENKDVRRAVSPRNCQECHEDQATQFANGKHALAWVAMEAMPTTGFQPKELIAQEKGCGGCHRIGRDEGKCDTCHTRHLFSATEARRPEACQTCHMGFDHPQWEMWSTSKHGTIYMTEGEDWDFSRKISEWYVEPYEASFQTPRAPVCVTCHMPEGDHNVRTAWGFLAVRLPEKDEEWMGYRAKILQGLGVLDAEGNPTERLDVVMAGDVARLTAEEWQAERDRMINVCTQCHTEPYAREKLEAADQVIKESDALMAEAVDIVQGLYDDGILSEPADYPANVDMLRFYEVENPIEQKLWVMFLEHRMRSFQGAFHMNPDYQHWYGWAEMKRDLAEIKAEAKMLRAEAGGQ